MSKHILSNVDGFVSRAGGEIYLVDPFCIKVVDGWNDRVDFSGQRELMIYIKESGVPQPLLVRKNKDNKLELRDGERRLRAVKALIDEGFETKPIPVQVEKKNTNEMDSYCRSLALNNGRPLSPSEQANSFKRLAAWGMSRQDIANKTGVSLSTVRNRLELSNAIPAVKEAVENNDITIKDAQKIIDNSDGKVKDQVESLEKVKSVPKKRTKTVVFEMDDFCQHIECCNFNNDKCDYEKKSDIMCNMAAKELYSYLHKNDFTISKRE